MGRCIEPVLIPKALFILIISSWKLKKAMSFQRGPRASDKVEAAWGEGQKEKGTERKIKRERKRERGRGRKKKRRRGRKRERKKERKRGVSE